mgnify:CR=1 FL=1
MGGFFFEFELFRTASGPSRRVRETAFMKMASSRDRGAPTPSLGSHESLHQDAVDAMPRRTDLTEMLRAGRRNKAYSGRPSSHASRRTGRAGR